MKQFMLKTNSGDFYLQAESMLELLKHLSENTTLIVTSIEEIPTVTVKSMMNGKDVIINAKDKGSCLDPSTERYWSM